MKIAILCAVFFSSTQFTPVEAQEKSSAAISQTKTAPVAFNFVRGHKQGKGYSVQWSVSSATSVESFEIQSTYEDPNDDYSNWYTVGTMNGKRGNVFQFNDLNVLPGMISYRIVAVIAGARGTITSPVFTTAIK